MEHPSNGNVRELINALEQAAVMSKSDTIGLAQFPDSILHPKPQRLEGIVSLDDHIRETLRQYGDKMEVQEIADKLGISRKTLWEKKKKWGL